MKKKDNLTALEFFIKIIKNQEIKLIDLNFEANPNIRGIFGDEKEIKRTLEFTLEGIGIGEGKNKRKKSIILSGKYIINFQDILEKGGDEEKLISANLTYELILFFEAKDFNKFKKEFRFQNNEEVFDIADMFFIHSGRLIIFPYVRHIIDMLMREAGIITSPIKPLMFKK